MYHASMRNAGKRPRQEQFHGGFIRILLATCPFGMGVDVPDIEAVLLHCCPSDGLTFSQNTLGA